LPFLSFSFFFFFFFFSFFFSFSFSFFLFLSVFCFLFLFLFLSLLLYFPFPFLFPFSFSFSSIRQMCIPRLMHPSIWKTITKYQLFIHLPFSFTAPIITHNRRRRGGGGGWWWWVVGWVVVGGGVGGGGDDDDEDDDYNTRLHNMIQHKIQQLAWSSSKATQFAVLLDNGTVLACDLQIMGLSGSPRLNLVVEKHAEASMSRPCSRSSCT
jgi:hypothetical protein